MPAENLQTSDEAQMTVAAQSETDPLLTRTGALSNLKGTPLADLRETLLERQADIDMHIEGYRKLRAEANDKIRELQAEKAQNARLLNAFKSRTRK
jgi:hypothetical protein